MLTWLAQWLQLLVAALSLVAAQRGVRSTPTAGKVGLRLTLLKVTRTCTLTIDCYP